MHLKVVLAFGQWHTIERLGKQLPFPASLRPAFPGSETFLLLPLFLEQQWVGVLAIVKASAAAYTPEEIALAKAVTAQTMLLIEAIHYLYAQEEHQRKRSLRAIAPGPQRVLKPFCLSAVFFSTLYRKSPKSVIPDIF